MEVFDVPQLQMARRGALGDLVTQDKRLSPWIRILSHFSKCCSSEVIPQGREQPGDERSTPTRTDLNTGGNYHGRRTAAFSCGKLELEVIVASSRKAPGKSAADAEPNTAKWAREGRIQKMKCAYEQRDVPAGRLIQDQHPEHGADDGGRCDQPNTCRINSLNKSKDAATTEGTDGPDDHTKD
ncbi:hypothetical protein OBBRIDRAFT_805918 [Obba rivulosa]|uniref:Uncharacterized protein n=1 Tax=Obba rivulosa TaxID=1052685 RepID=A0A8E2AN89_9APHY|nr:hypothetical protein OBBRIDRAFT_805918 [Obba rivulosa]